MQGTIVETAQAAMSAKPWLETYQPLVGLIVGVTLGLASNAALLWGKQALEDRRARRAGRVALLHELEIYEDLHRRQAQAIYGPGEWLIRVAIPENFPMFDTFQQSIGLLSTEEVRTVVAAYAQLSAMPAWLSSLGSGPIDVMRSI